MRFHVRVGILPHERELPQPLEIDLAVRVAPGMAGVLDYRELYAAVRMVVDAEPLEYLETIGESILAGVLAMSGVSSARVAVRKPHVALGGPLAHAEVVVEAARG
jgi:dihydroneopterin aldolase